MTDNQKTVSRLILNLFSVCLSFIAVFSLAHPLSLPFSFFPLSLQIVLNLIIRIFSFLHDYTAILIKDAYNKLVITCTITSCEVCTFLWSSKSKPTDSAHFKIGKSGRYVCKGQKTFPQLPYTYWKRITSATWGVENTERVIRKFQKHLREN